MTDLPPLLDAALARMVETGAARRDDPALRAEVEGWIGHLLADPPEIDELHRQVSLHARNLGAEARPASVATLRVLGFVDAARAADAASPATSAALVRIAADAHAVGAEARARGDWLRALADGPVVVLGGQVVGFVVGSMAPDVVDAILGRTLRAAAGVGCRAPILDVTSAPPDDATFHRTLAGFAQSPDLGAYTLRVTGLRAPEATRAALGALGVPEARVELRADLADALPR